VIPSFETRKKQWSAPPVDDIGYLPSVELLDWPEDDLLDVIARMAESRYDGWRNWEMNWRVVLGLDRTRDKDVLDYGCGVGLEALQYAKKRNRVWLADISETNIALAERVLQLSGYHVEGSFLAKEAPPVIQPGSFDVIHCVGVLHHIPDPEPVVAAMAGWLRPEGELRLMVYSDEAWRISTGTEPPKLHATFADPNFRLFWQHWDPIGGYADWYDCEKLEHWFGEWFTVAECKPLTEFGEYLGAVLVKR
jgi:SAM-dependent methyltransferase